MDFPTREKQIRRFCDRMLDGYFWHAADFPHIYRVGLIAKRGGYNVAYKNLAEAKAQLRMAGKAKSKSLSELKKVMCNCLRKSEVDTASNPEKLRLIGWSPKDKPKPSEIPNQPLNLRIIAKENQAMQLEWDRPADDTRIRNYLIERRQPGNQPSDWQSVNISYKTNITLDAEPVTVPLEYRVKAANIAGESLPSNVVSVILP